MIWKRKNGQETIFVRISTISTDQTCGPEKNDDASADDAAADNDEFVCPLFCMYVPVF